MIFNANSDNRLNLSEWSLKNRVVVWYFIAVVAVFGIFSYTKLGRMEDPDFVVRTMVISASWPGATAAEMEEQVTDKIEQKMYDLPKIDYLRSYSRPGQCVVYINLKDTIKSDDIRPTWRDARNMGEELKKDLPEGVYGPYYNDRFDDVFGSVYAVTGDGYSLEELRREAERIRRLILAVPDVKKVDLVGVQPEKVYIEAKRDKLASLGLTPTAIASALKTQNNLAPAAMIETETDNLYVRLTGTFDSVEEIKNAPLRAGARVIRVGDIAQVERRSVEPSEPLMFFNGQPAVGIAVSMEPGGNVIQLGKNLEGLMRSIRVQQPVGLTVDRVADQPAVVAESIDDFVGNLREAVVIVMIMSLLSLGLRTGIVVGICIPLVLAGTFCVMYLQNIDLHKISLGSLIVSLGLLVDDEIIAIEMMSVKLDEGMSKLKAAAAVFSEAAVPMFYGTLITCSGFIPVGFAPGQASEFCAALFPVIVSTLLLSWLVAIMVTPLFGSYLINPTPYRTADENDALGSAAAELENPMYKTRFYVIFRRILVAFLRHRALTLGATVAIFAVSLLGLKHIRQEFFPPSTRPEIIIDLRLPEGSSQRATAEEALRFSRWLDAKKDQLSHYSYYVGKGAPRFILTLEPVLPASNFAQIIAVAKDYPTRLALTEEIRQELAQNYTELRATIKTIQTGPPSEYPIMLRVSGYDKDEVRRIANQAMEKIREDANVRDISLNWNEKVKSLKLTLDQDKLRQLGVSGQEIAQTLYTEITGASVAQYYKGDRTISVTVRLDAADRDSLAKIGELPIYLSGATKYVPLNQLAKIDIAMEDGLIWRRSSRPTATIQGTVYSGTANDTTQKAYDDIADLRAGLPFGYSIDVDGALESSHKASAYLTAPLPMMFLTIMTLLVILQRSIKTVAMTLLTIPLGIIGVVAGMLIFDKAIGFVAILGVLSLSGMVARNSIILIDQIQRHEEQGQTPWDAVINSALIRFRPIMLTAGTSILGMVPLMTSAFWGPMAVAIAVGLFCATALTLLVLPTMYAVFYKVEIQE